jgi:NarL family two-component system response regulator LiaR
MNLNKTEKSGMKILIVDDREPARLMIKRYLSNLANEFCECADGAEALGAYRAFMPDWVLMDWEMKRMDGLAASRSIIKDFPQARIVMITQYCDKELRRAANEAGVRGFFPKDELLDLSEFFKKQQLVS